MKKVHLLYVNMQEFCCILLSIKNQFMYVMKLMNVTGKDWESQNTKC